MIREEFFLGTGQFQFTKEKLKKNGYGHLKSIKSLYDLKLTRNPAWKEAENKEISSLEVTSKENPPLFVCPISGLQTNGRHQFTHIRRDTKVNHHSSVISLIVAEF